MTENIEPVQSAETEPVEPKTYTQEQVEQIVKDRLKNVKSAPPADYEELKAKAEKFDAVEEAAKSELQKAVERAEKAESELKGMKEAQLHAQAVKAAAKEHGVDEEILSLMSGDVEQNALFLKERQEAQKPAYPSVTDNGELPAQSKLTLEDIDRIPDHAERMAAYAKYYQQENG